ncbi:hypothetical protein DFH08DRAFT_808258 [Mycena albidolilacea]|uniref:Uncharacterized protein n=1 Tax=Mycena albidolilacea TaxID=1033008 RepID=A0AAD7ETT4_9AGAR|nr:hypothetical protein DFH08DRAFT_808258 [Mycena albidolilacea]
MPSPHLFSCLLHPPHSTLPLLSSIRCLLLRQALHHAVHVNSALLRLCCILTAATARAAQPPLSTLFIQRTLHTIQAPSVTRTSSGSNSGEAEGFGGGRIVHVQPLLLLSDLFCPIMGTIEIVWENELCMFCRASNGVVVAYAGGMGSGEVEETR